MAAEPICFRDFELDPARYELRRGHARIKLERIPMELLILLAHSAGRLVERREVVEAIWGKDNFFDSDSAINTAIRKLRRILGDDPKQPEFIETVPGKGYRFLILTSHGRRARDAEALYAKGLHFWNRKTPAAYSEATKLFQAAIDLDPDYPAPYVGLAKTWILLGIHGLQPAHDVYPRARAAASKALELDSEFAEAYTAMADIFKGYDWNWSQAESYYLRALELDPRSALAHQWYANLLSITGRHEEALQHAIEARALEPLSVGPAGFVAFTYYRGRRFREALREAESALTMEPNSPVANWFLGLILIALNRLDEAQTVLSTAVEQSQGATMYSSALGYVCAAREKSTRASKILAGLQERNQERYVSPVDMAIIYMGLDEIDAAFGYLDLAFTQRVMRLTELPMPSFDPLRADPRYEAMLARMRLVAV